MRFLRAFALIAVFGAALFLPHDALAANTSFFGPIYPNECKCDTSTIGYESAPAFGCAMVVLKNIIDVMLSIGVIIFVLAASFAGFMFMTSAMNSRGKEMGRSMLLNAVIGLVIALGAWLIVDFIMKALYNPEANFNGRRIGPWNEILVGDGSQQAYCIPKTAQGTLDMGTAPGPTFSSGQRVECNIGQDESVFFPGVVTASRVVDDGNPNTPSADMVTVDFDGDEAGGTEILASECRSIGGSGDENDTQQGSGENCPAADPSSMVAFPDGTTTGGAESATQTTVTNFLAMRTAALEDGIDLRVQEGYRSDAEQVQIWNSRNCGSANGCSGGAVARPCSLGGGGSNHNSGTALDLNVGCSPSATSCNTPAFNWLKQNGAQWNFRNTIPPNQGASVKDPVHWSPSGR